MGGGRTAVRTDLNNFHLQLEVKFKPTKISLKWKDPLKMFRNPWPGYKYISNENLSTIRKSNKNLGTQSLKYGPYNITWLIRYNFGKSYTKMKTSHNFDFRIFLRSDFELHVLVHVSVCVIEPISIRAFNPLSADIKEAVCASPKLQVSKEHWMFDCSNCTKNWSIFLRFNSLFHSLAQYSLFFSIWIGSVTPESKFSGSIEQDLVCRAIPLPSHANLLFWHPSSSFFHSLDGLWNSVD